MKKIIVAIVLVFMFVAPNLFAAPSWRETHNTTRGRGQ